MDAFEVHRRLIGDYRGFTEGFVRSATRASPRLWLGRASAVRSGPTRG